MMRRHFRVLVLLIAPVFISWGCGGSGNTVWVTGKLVKGGAKYAPPQGEVVNMTFVCIEMPDSSGKAVESSEAFQAMLDQDSGAFSVPGTEGRGIPPGKYRIAVTQKMTREAFEAAKPRLKKGFNRETDTLGNKFSLGSSPIIRELKTGGDLVVDLDKPAGQ